MDPSTGSKVNIGLPDDEFGRKVLVGSNRKIADYFSMENPLEDHVYDFGDNWEHKIKHEEMLEWAGGEFDPEHFDCEDVSFDDTTKRLKMARG